MNHGKNLVELIEVMRTLLGPEGCPWDKEQTFESLRPFVIEEAFEVVDAIDSGDRAALREELGDLLYQIVFQAEIARAEGAFGMDEIIDGIKEKMIRRHPWVFGDEEVGGESAEERWEAIKAREKRESGTLGGVPLALPALLRATRVSEKAAAVGFDWSDAEGARRKIDEELREVDEAETQAALEAEIGDLLFAVTSFARHRGVDPEAALRGTIDRFTARFSVMERAVISEGRALRELDDAALDEAWEAAKATLRAQRKE